MMCNNIVTGRTLLFDPLQYYICPKKWLYLKFMD